MPPEVFSWQCQPLSTPLIPSQLPASAKSQLKTGHKHFQAIEVMKFTKRKFIPILVFILISASILRLLKITMITTTQTAALAPAILQTCSTGSPGCKKISSHNQGSYSIGELVPSANASTNILTTKEMQFLSNIISLRVPCNLLVFGFGHEYLNPSSLNAKGITVFLEDDPNNVSSSKSIVNNTQIYEVKYKTPAKEAYKLLKHARKNTGCSPRLGLLNASMCKLALEKLPQIVYDLKWDVIVVDSPSGEGPEAPGRMAAIYTAGLLARMGNRTDVLVHDVDRMIEKWFSWEFLCDSNLVSSKGKFWNFRIDGGTNSTTFCLT